MKYVIVCGSVMSGLGKGVVTSSLGFLLKSVGFNVTAIKIDPYLNIDAGTINPYDHGETFVLESGAEVDLDLGNYERFLNIRLTPDHNLTTGKIYRKVIDDEREGKYLGKTVQIVPHLTNAIQDWIKRVALIPVDENKSKEPNVCMIELGGTVGDIESAPFIEALRQFQYSMGEENVTLVNVSYVPFMGEHKTKPTQAAVRDLRGLGLIPDMIVCRSDTVPSESVLNKIALFCHLPLDRVLVAPNVDNIYRVPMLLDKQNALNILYKSLRLGELPDERIAYYYHWVTIMNRSRSRSVNVAIVGKYTNLPDCYYSLIQALKYAAWSYDVNVDITWIESTDWTDTYQPPSFDGMVVPGGFGERGTEGMIRAIRHARENKIPYLGICLGMQLAIVEYARNVMGLDKANSTEFDPQTPHPVVTYMPEISETQMGGTMRLGLKAIYDDEEEPFSYERHRHRYEVNPEYIERLVNAGLMIVHRDESGKRTESIRLSNHPFMVGVQYHPEYNSYPLYPHGVFCHFIEAMK